jgi:hypothetical protein
MALMSKASSISDLVRFFSESPLDGLRGESSGSSNGSSAPATAPGSATSTAP